MVAERLGPEATHALLGLGRHAAREVRAWDAVLDLLPGLGLQWSEGRFEVARAALRGYDNVLAGRILRAAAGRAGLHLAPAASSRLARFAGQAASGRRLALGSGLVAEAAFESLVVGRSVPAPAPVTIDAVSGEAPFGPLSVAWRSEPAPATVPRGGWTTWIVPGRLVMRVPRAGDSVAPLGGVGHRKVARLLMEARVPRSERAAYPIVASGEDVLWIPGICRSATGIPDPGREAVRIDARAG